MAVPQRQPGRETSYGRRTYDIAHEACGKGQGPVPNVPNFVLTHRPKEPDGPLMKFVASVEEALEQARAATGDKNVEIMGANAQQQFLKAGLIDEISVDIVPVILSEGVRLFDHLEGRHIRLKQIKSAAGGQVTHLTYAVIK